MTHGASWTDQWARLSRWHQRVRRTRDEWQVGSAGTEECRDDIFATFQAIWHLKDWLSNDRSTSVTGKDVDAWLEARHSVLLVAADLANGSKHLSLHKKRAGGSRQTRNDARIHIGRGVQFTFYVVDERTSIEWEAVDLADSCIAEWKQFLSESGLPPPANE